MDKANGSVKSVNRSYEKATIKHAVDSVQIDITGISQDVDAGQWHRQIGILAWEDIAEFARKNNRTIAPGELGEHITLQKVEVNKMQLFDRLLVGGVELEVTQVAGDKHTAGERGTLLENKGVFARVIKSGTVQVGDHVELNHKYFALHLLIVSDGGSRHFYRKRTGELIKEMLMDFCKAHFPNFSLKQSVVINDEQVLTREFYRSKQLKHDLFFTVGGTGWGKHDITTATLRNLLTREMSGIMQWVKGEYGAQNPAIFLSDALAGIADDMLVFSLPGNLSAAKEYMQELAPLLKDIVLNFNGIDIYNR